MGQVTLIIQQALRPLVNKIQELEKQREVPTTAPAPVTEETVTSNVIQLVEMSPIQEKPTFSGGSQNPITFTEDLKDYKRSDVMILVKESFRGSARSWMKLYWKLDFERDSLANYRGDIQQKNLRRKLQDDVWQPKKGTSMLGHFAKYWEFPKTLKITKTSLGIINEIMRHFPKETQSLWFSWQGEKETN